MFVKSAVGIQGFLLRRRRGVAPAREADGGGHPGESEEDRAMSSPSDGLIRELKSFRRKVSTRYGVQRMILFGSRARGGPRRDSDVDLIVVSPKFKRKNIVERASPLYMEWDLNLPVDFLCYTPEEFDELSKRPSIVRVALDEGILIS